MEVMGNITALKTDVTIITVSNIKNVLPNLHVCVPTTLMPYRGRFAAIPEVFPTLLSRGFKPSLLSTIDIKIT